MMPGMAWTIHANPCHSRPGLRSLSEDELRHHHDVQDWHDEHQTANQRPIHRKALRLNRLKRHEVRCGNHSIDEREEAEAMQTEEAEPKEAMQIVGEQTHAASGEAGRAEKRRAFCRKPYQ